MSPLTDTQGTGSLTPIATINPTGIPTESPTHNPTIRPSASPTTAALSFTSFGPGEVSHWFWWELHFGISKNWFFADFDSFSALMPTMLCTPNLKWGNLLLMRLPLSAAVHALLVSMILCWLDLEHVSTRVTVVTVTFREALYPQLFHLKAIITVNITMLEMVPSWKLANELIGIALFMLRWESCTSLFSQSAYPCEIILY